MSTPKLTSILLSAFFASACLGMTACDKTGGGSKKKSPRLRWVNKPVTGTTENDGKIIKIPGIAIDFYTPDTLYVYKTCTEPAHTAAGPEDSWIPVIRCARTSDEDSSEEDEWAEEEDTEAPLVLTIFATTKEGTIINERAKASLKLQYEQAGFEVESVEYYDEYLSKQGRRGIMILAHTIDPSTGYPDREIRRFMFPKGDVLFIGHIDYPYGADRSGIERDWERILWNFQYAEDGPLFK